MSGQAQALEAYSLKQAQYPLNRRLDGPQMRYGNFREVNVARPCWEKNPGSLSP